MPASTRSKPLQESAPVDTMQTATLRRSSEMPDLIRASRLNISRTAGRAALRVCANLARAGVTPEYPKSKGALSFGKGPLFIVAKKYPRGRLFARHVADLDYFRKAKKRQSLTRSRLFAIAGRIVLSRRLAVIGPAKRSTIVPFCGKSNVGLRAHRRGPIKRAVRRSHRLPNPHRDRQFVKNASHCPGLSL